MLEGPGRPEPADPGGRRRLRALRHQALIATDVAFTLTDPRRADNPLLWVNPAFTRLTGYPAAEAVGRNPRFLQGRDTDPAVTEQIRLAIAARRAITVTILNHRKDGTPFWNRVAINPVFDAEGEVTNFVGVLTDVSEQVALDEEHTRALESERIARRETERARARLATLVETTTELTATLDLDEALDLLTSVTVPRMADWVTINLVDDHGEITRTTARHRDGREELVARVIDQQPISLTEEAGVSRVLSGSGPILLAEASPDLARRHFTNPELVDVLAGLGLGSIMFVPLVSRLQRIVGVMILAAMEHRRRFNTEDLTAAADLGRRAGLTIDHARIYEQEHHAAVTLQRGLLPPIGPVPGTTIAVRYVPGEATADVGGDFYDVLDLPDGSVGFVIGDVVGHDVAAAAAMSHLRGILRVCAWDDVEDGRGNPGLVLDRVDQLIQRLEVTSLATVFYGRLIRDPGGGAVFRYANAGHPTPLLRSPAGVVTRLADASSVLLGAGDYSSRPSAEVTVDPGSLLVGYTDGLVERRGCDIDDGIAGLAEALAALPAGVDPDTVAAQLLATAPPGRSDDIALLVLRADGEASG